jgi:hypothetical protein
MNTKLILSGFLILRFMTSCVVYHPHMVDIPLISKKNDLRIDAGVSVVPSVNTTVSYGLTDRIAVQAYGSFGADDRFMIQGALGYYKDLGSRKIMEIYSGFGYGYGSAYKNSNPGDLYGGYQSYFAQFNFGKVNNRFAHMDYGIGMKAGFLHSDLTDQNYYEYNSESAPNLNYQDKSILFEPVGFIRMGGEKLKFELKLGGCLIYKLTNTEKNFPYSHFNLGLGINYMF